MTDQLRITLYRADRRPGLRTIGGVRSWTTSLEYATRYQTGFYGTFGGPHLYQCTTAIDPTTAVDLRSRIAENVVCDALITVMDMMGIDEIPVQSTHTLLQEAIPLLRSLGTRWVVFNEYGFDEWLSLGTCRVRVAAVAQP